MDWVIHPSVTLTLYGISHAAARRGAFMYVDLAAATAVAASSRGASRSGPEVTPERSL
jgi:hypothetical protein